MASDSKTVNSERRLLCVVAHPDDETFGSGSTLIKYAAEGASVFTSCATRGDVGEIADRSDATPETLSAVREQEYYDAGKVMGVKQSILYGFRDSGMAGSPDNDHPNAYIKVPMDEVVAKVVDTIRELKPQVVFTFDEGGGYGHPDHIHASEATKLAYFAAGDPSYEGSTLEPWKPSKLYYHGFPRSMMRKWFAAFAEADPDSDLAKLDPEEMGVPDETLTTELDISAHAETRRKAIEVHQTQYSPLDRMPSPELEADFLNTDFFIRVDPPLADGESGIVETDLFEGLGI
ncbi:PIG-L family deacetylase [Candidatus Lucifugimonas marina]|uniref:PIG-L family deacetylase n=1 Tax=Candidatus Lucifugimonas marina TaxID=3038979 RepID=UPI00319DD853